MAVNTNVYGTPEQWYDSDFQQANLSNKNKTACFDATQGVPWSSLGLAVDAGKLSWSEPIDKSLSYCGLGAESSFSTICYYDNSGQVIDTNERTVTNFAFFEKSNDTQTLSDNTFFSTSSLDYFTWQTADTFNRINFSRQLKPLTLVNPKNIVLSIFIRATTNNLTNDVDVSLKTYLENYKSTHTLIKDVYLKFWYGNIAEIGIRETLPFKYLDNRRPFMLSILDEYEMTSKNIKFNAYDIDSPSIFGVISLTNYIGVNDTTSFRMIYCTPTAKNHIVFRTFNDAVYGYIEYYPEFDEDIIKSVACFGLYFTPNDSICQLGSLTNQDMYIGILDRDGVGHGKYLKGSETVDAPQNNYSDMSECGYDYTKQTDPNIYSDKTKFGNFTNSLLSSYAYYVAPLSLITGLLSPTLSALSEVASYPEPTNKWLFDSSFVFQEPIECILAWRKIFFKPATLNGSLHNISIGWFTTQNAGSQAYISQVENERYLLADIEIYPRYGDFRDYEPYTTMALFVPYCGMKELPLATFMGHRMQLYLIKNYRTGALEVLIMVDNKYWGNMTGNASIELPLSGNKSMEYIKSRMEIEQQIEDTMMNSFSSMVGNAAGATISLAHGNPAGALIQAGAGVLNAIQGVDQVAHLDYQLDHLANKIVNIQKGSTSTTPCEILYPYILIKRPRMAEGYDEDIYSKTIGHATLENKMKNSLRGYIEATSPLLDGIPCTDTERKLIVKALEEGCIFDEE